MKMNPGTRPARSSRFGPAPDAGTDSSTAADAENDQVSADGRFSAIGLPPALAGAGNDGPRGCADISSRFIRSFPGCPDQVAPARHFVAAALAGCPAAPDAVLLASELATNAVRHSATGRGGSFTVAISHAPGRVRITVTDDGSDTRPVLPAGAPGPLACSGRGLLLVDALSGGWGHAAGGPSRRAAVWFELPCP
jgi:hypothetical protein